MTHPLGVVPDTAYSRAAVWTVAVILCPQVDSRLSCCVRGHAAGQGLARLHHNIEVFVVAAHKGSELLRGLGAEAAGFVAFFIV